MHMFHVYPIESWKHTKMASIDPQTHFSNTIMMNVSIKVGICHGIQVSKFCQEYGIRSSLSDRNAQANRICFRCI